MTTHPHTSLQGMLLPQVCLWLVVLLFIFVYVGFCFEWWLVVGVVIVLVYDVIIMLGILLLFYLFLYD